MPLSFQSGFLKFMKFSEGKCYLLTFGTIQSNIKMKIGEAIVEESSEEKLLKKLLGVY